MPLCQITSAFLPLTTLLPFVLLFLDLVMNESQKLFIDFLIFLSQDNSTL